MFLQRSSGLARSLTMWDKNSVQKTSESRTSSRPQASGSSAQLPTSPTNAGSSNEGQGNVRDDPFSDPSGEPATAAASGSGSEQYVYAASAALNPFHNNPAIIVSTVDLAAVGENSRLQVALIPRNLEESIVLRSMPFAEAFPGNVIQRSMSEIHE
ncbi:uncharacterized protein B0H18DRAFT_612431 [Fomitopsis serialis]|uniref:uncharacterized protein n=1 Tax=Fomitopsis serialis TaxID=139415 RepID=UPI00200857D5|nr:uncharacterized protein B0H18DRAFT_612431 [Neoantrodia serialis]KAH9920124.1 hypothetical protein B0H18DRAFT_612431 [Neoantrodia serialis]